MRLERLGLELGMELAAEIPWMAGQLTNLYVNSIRRLTCQTQSMLLQHLFVFAVELIAMTMALADLHFPVGAAGDAVVGE